MTTQKKTEGEVEDEILERYWAEGDAEGVLAEAVEGRDYRALLAIVAFDLNTFGEVQNDTRAAVHRALGWDAPEEQA